MEKTEISACVAGGVSIVEPRASFEGVEFVSQGETGMGEFEIDRSALQSAIVNFLENAVDACIMDAAKASHRVSFKAKKEAENVCFEVRDNGTGMDRETMNRMFSLFFSSKGSRGTGLGLFISNQVVEKHGGKVSIESIVGEGSIFYIRIPETIPESVRKASGETIESEM